MQFIFKTPFKRLLVLFLAVAVLLAILPLTILAAHSWSNGGFNTPFNDLPERGWRDQIEKIADGWTPFYIDENTYPGSGNASKLHWMSDVQFDVVFGSAPFTGYHIEGDGSQNMWSAYEFDAGVYQQITGVTPGQDYGFDIGMVTYWRGPGYPDTDGVMVKQVGIDPYGGTDPTGSSVIWSEPDSDDKNWVYMDVAATAQAGTVTVFAKVYAPENTSYNHTDLESIYFDAAHFDVAPGTTLNAAASGTTVNLDWSGGAAAGWSVKGYEVQYKEQTAESWSTLQAKTGQDTTGSFTGLAGRTYTIRARTWQSMSEPYHSDIDIPGVWVETGVTLGQAIVGRVINHAGLGVSGVTVAVSGTATSTVSTNGGNYTLATGSSGIFDIRAADFGDRLAPPSVPVSTTLTTVGALTITLRPADDPISNYGFELGLTGWAASGAAGVSNTHRHSGAGSVLLGSGAVVSQTGVVTGMRAPLLSFWYKSDGSTTLVAQFLGEAGAIHTKTLNAAGGWTHVTLDSGMGDHYTGTVGVKFSHTGGDYLFIDEASIGAGPYKTFLPITLKNG